MRVAAGWSLDPAALTPESGPAELALFGVIWLSGLHL
jgi:hypothetical protein